MKKKLKVTLLRGLAGKAEQHRLVLGGLGLRRPRQTVVVENTPSFRGMIKKVLHLVNVEESHG